MKGTLIAALAASAITFGFAARVHACDGCLLAGRDLHAVGGTPSGSLLTTAMTPVAPAFNSLPGATATLFLDFDGIVYPGTWAGRTPGTVPAYNTDADASTFSASELDDIFQVWSRVAEAYSPFNVNVTTVDPGDFTLQRVNTRVIIGGSNTWYSSGAGGVAYVGGFADDPGTFETRTGWTFETVLQPRDTDPPVTTHVKKVADATIHEAGHQFGLWHQADFDGDGNFIQDYRRTQDGGLTAPNMGVAYQAVRSLWSNGPRSQGGSPNQQLDLQVLASTFANQTTDEPWPGYYNDFGFRPDDWGDSIAEAVALEFEHGRGWAADGIIGLSSDVDVFSFIGTGGVVDILVDGATYGQMLDLLLGLYDESGQLIDSDNPALSLVEAEGYGLDASLSLNLPAGEYFLAVASNGGYGDIGQYFVTVSGAAVPEPAGGLVLLGGLAMLLRRRRPGGGASPV